MFYMSHSLPQLQTAGLVKSYINAILISTLLAGYLSRQLDIKAEEKQHVPGIEQIAAEEGG